MKFRAQPRIHLCKLSIVACSLGAFASFPDVALAQTCTEDADCAPEDYCDRYPSSGDSSEGSSGDSSGSADDAAPPCIEGEECADAVPPEEEEIAPPSEPVAGQCERGGRSCTSDDECLAEHYCSFNDVDVATAACPPGEDCPDVELPPPSGRCEHVPYTCETDADCPEATVCGDDGECTFELQVCESDDDCGARYECLPMSGGGSDSAGDTVDEQDPAVSSGSGSSGMSIDDPGAADDSTEPKAAGEEPPASGDAQQDPDTASGGGTSGPPVPTDDPDAVDDPAASEPPGSDGANPVASSEEPDVRPAPEDLQQAEADAEAAESQENRAICFPKPDACESDEDCEGGWICAEADVDGVLGWEGVEKSCLPEGIAAVLAGDLDAEGGGTAEDGSTVGENPREDEDTNENAEPIGDDDSDVIDSLGTQGGSEGSEGCSVSTTPSRAGFGLGWLAAALGAGLFIRRRRAATSATRGSLLPDSRE